MPHPTQILTPNDAALAVLWDDGHESFYPAPLLRRECPCAVCKDEGKKPQSGLHLVAAGDGARFTLRNVHPVGNYAIGIVWGDGHQTGIYSWEYLRALCDCDSCTTSPQ